MPRSRIAVLCIMFASCSSSAPGDAQNGDPNAVPNSPTGPNPNNGWNGPRGPGQVVGVSPGTGDELCGGNVATTTFRWALCLCEDLAFSTVLETDGYSASAGPYTPGGLGGSVGTNGIFRSTGTSEIGGSLFSGGDVTPVGEHDIKAELHTGGKLTAAGDIHVYGDAYVAGNIIGAKTTIDGDLHIPAASRVLAAVDSRSVINEPVIVPPPCDCSSSSRLDIPGFVAQAAATNDNASIGLEPDSWKNLITPVDITLPAGKFYLDEISALAPIRIHVSTPTALYIGGNLRSVSVFEIVLDDPRGEIDIFIAGSIQASGDFELGTKSLPSHVRTYVAGGEDIVLAGDLDFGGNLYAPSARIVAAGPLDVFGSILARSMVEAGIVRLHYDRDILDAGDNCGPDLDPMAPPADPVPPNACTGCGDCNNQACAGGTCGACTSNADCCAPLICDNKTGACAGIQL